MDGTLAQVSILLRVVAAIDGRKNGLGMSLPRLEVAASSPAFRLLTGQRELKAWALGKYY